MKFSIIVPVYNVEKYIRKCLESILNQSYNNFEVIVVNDGSLDNSQAIIDEYTSRDERFQSYIKKNGGLSDARNYGLQHVTGDYLLFVDSDDYIAKDLLLNIKKALDKGETDLVAFNSIACDDDGNELSKRDILEYCNLSINDAIKDLVTRPFVETAWIYCYKFDFWQRNKFHYKKDMLHEDFGLTPLILYKANTISSINYFGYYYIQRSNSITKTRDYEKTLKKVDDFYKQYTDSVELLSKKPKSRKKEVLITYMSECMILKLRELNDYDYKKYVKKIRINKIVSNISPYNFKKIIKKTVALVSPKLYIKLFFK